MRVVRLVLIAFITLCLWAYRNPLKDNLREYEQRQKDWAYKQQYERHDQDYKRYKLGDLIPVRPRMSESDMPSFGALPSRFYVWVIGPYSAPLCSDEECGPNGDMAEKLGGALAGRGEHEAGAPVEARTAYILVGNSEARIIGIYPRCTTEDLPDILARHPETGAVASPVIPRRLTWHPRCRPDFTTGRVLTTDLWRQALSANSPFIPSARAR